jgi:hypothetical protein
MIPVQRVRFNAQSAENNFGPVGAEKLDIIGCDSAIYNGRGKIYHGVVAVQQGYSVIFTFHGVSYNK